MKNLSTKAGVLGWPVEHSLSPRLHNYWLKKYGIEGSYEALPVEPEKLAALLKALPVQGFRGVNLTIPHKEMALKIVDHIEPLAQQVGAINTIIVREDGSLEGRNTDVFGFAQNLRAQQVDVKGKPVTVLGAGGAARAAIVALREMGAAEIRLVNRTREKAEMLKREFGDLLPIYEWAEYPKAFEGTSLLANTTPLGMKSPETKSPFDLSALPKTAVVTDIVYTPLMTGLLKDAHARGHKIVDGLGMLIYQAQPAFKAWFGIEPEVTPGLRATMIEAL